MFKKLKDKIAEEVKISPQRMQQIQQFTQSMTDKLQQGLEQGTTSPDDGLFSISEDDSKADAGFTNVPLVVSTSAPELPPRPRRNSNSSIASDVSFLPRYEASTSAYHLQSDLDASASEVEDNLSQQSSTLGHVSKEQVHTAFQKAQMRYHKYRGRYTDLAGHYRELERENAKMKAVLVETQDKAIRRVSELKEQCTLGQRAKADLEAALRVEIEEKQIVIDSLKQKVDLLQVGAHVNGNDGLVTSVTNGSNVSHEDLVADLNDKLQECKANSIVSKEKLAALQRELDETKKTLREAAEREKANNQKFAKSKLDLHTELQNRELEMANMRQDMQTMRVDLEAYEKGGALKAQNANLIDKCDALKARNHELEAELVKAARYELEMGDLREQLREVDGLKATLREYQEKRDESRAQVAEIAHLKSQLADIDGLKMRLEENDLQLQAKDKDIDELRSSLDEMLAKEETLAKLRQKHAEELRALQEETKQSLVALQDRIQRTLATEYREKERQLRADFEVKLQQLHQDGDSFKQTQIKLMQAEDELRTVAANHGECSAALSALRERNVQLEKEYVVLMEENNGRQGEIAGLRAQLKSLQSNIDGEQRKLKHLQEDKLRLEADGRKALEDSIKSEAVLNEEVLRLRDEVEAKNSALKLLEDDKHQQARVFVENEELQREVERFARRERMMSDEMAAVKENEHLLEGKLTEVNNSVDVLQATIDGLIEAENELKGRLKDAHDALEVKISSANEQGVECARLNEQLVVRTREFEAVTEEKRSLSLDVAGLERNLHAFEQNALRLQEKCAQLERTNEELRRQESRWKETAKGLEDDLEGKKVDAEQASGTISELRREMGTKDEDILRLRTTLEATTQDSEVITTQMRELTTKIDELEQLQVKLVGVQNDYTKLRENHEQLTTKHEKGEEHRELLKAQLAEATDANQLAATRWRTEKEALIAQLEALSAKFEKLDASNAYEAKCNELERLRVNYEQVDERVAELQETVALLQEKEESLMQSQLMEKQTLIDQLNDASGKYQEVFVQFEAVTKDNRNVNHLLEVKSEEMRETLEVMRRNEEKLKRDAARTEERLREQATIVEALGKFKTMYADAAGALEAMTNEMVGCKCEVDSLTSRNAALYADNKRLMDENDKLLAESADVMLQLATKITNTDAEVAAKLQDVTAQYNDALAAAARAQEELHQLQRQTATLDASRLQHEKQIGDLEQHVGELEQERQFLKDEIDELKTTPINNVTRAAPSEKDVESLQATLARYKSIDQTNRSSIEFYEHELQKVRAKNEKLNRRLDETLVTLNHCADLSASTEVEYLKNVLYNYMLGKESVVLARVIAAVCKFDRQQTETVLKHEQHKQSLLGQLGIL